MINKFECPVERHKKVVEISPSGRLDSGQVASFEKILLNRINAGDQHIVLNFNRLMFISSSGLRILLLGGKKFRAKKGTLLLCELKPAIQDLLKTAGFQGLLAIRQERAVALQEAAEAAGCAETDEPAAEAAAETPVADRTKEVATKTRKGRPDAAVRFAQGMKDHPQTWSIGSLLLTLLTPWRWFRRASKSSEETKPATASKAQGSES